MVSEHECQGALTQKQTLGGGGALQRGHDTPPEPLAQLRDALRGVGAVAAIVKAAELLVAQAELAQRGRGRQHDAEQLRFDDAKALTIKVQAADRVVLAQLLHRNPTHRPTRRARHCCEQQLVRRLTLALVDAAAQGRTAKGGASIHSAPVSYTHLTLPTICSV